MSHYFFYNKPHDAEIVKFFISQGFNLKLLDPERLKQLNFEIWLVQSEHDRIELMKLMKNRALKQVPVGVFNEII